MVNTPLNVVKATLQEIVAAMDKGEITSKELVQVYLDNIDRDNIKGLGLRAVIETAPIDKLFNAAERLDAERAEGKKKSPLHGVPILIKDSICTDPSMGMETTGGTIVLKGSIVAGNSPIVDLCLQSGIIILGKANMAVLGGFYGEHPNGWSPRGGQTVSFGNAAMKPSGSSSGSAVGLAAGFCAASIGCETIGSIICPAQRASLYALKPTVGLVPAKNVIGISARIDCLGPMGKSAWDVAALLEQIASPPRPFTKFALAPYNNLSTSPIPYRLGVPSPCFPAKEYASEEVKAEAQAMFDAAINKLGLEFNFDPADIEGMEELFEGDGPSVWMTGPLRRLLLTESWEALNDHLGSLKNCEVKNYEELVKWNNDHPDLAFHSPGKPNQQCHLEAALEIRGARDQAYQQALATTMRISQYVEQTIDDHNLDVLVFPPGRAPTVAATVGFPIATVPMGQLSDKTPWALHLLAKRGDDEKLIGMMAVCESIFGSS